MTTASKSEFRQQMRGRLRAFPEEARAAASALIMGSVEKLPRFREAHRVGLYIGCGYEVRTNALLAAAEAAGKEVFLPAWNASLSGYCFARAFAGDALVPGPHGIPQPEVLRHVSAKELDLVFVPGLCFSPGCARLGRGGGVYDRLLAGLGSECGAGPFSPFLLGLAFSIQIVPSIPCSEHDVLLHAVVTEKENYAVAKAVAAGS